MDEGSDNTAATSSGNAGSRDVDLATNGSVGGGLIDRATACYAREPWATGFDKWDEPSSALSEGHTDFMSLLMPLPAQMWLNDPIDWNKVELTFSTFAINTREGPADLSRGTISSPIGGPPTHTITSLDGEFHLPRNFSGHWSLFNIDPIRNGLPSSQGFGLGIGRESNGPEHFEVIIEGFGIYNPQGGLSIGVLISLDRNGTLQGVGVEPAASNELWKAWLQGQGWQ